MLNVIIRPADCCRNYRGKGVCLMASLEHRAKVRLEFSEKLFYEKTLIDWKENISNSNHAYVIKKALENLKRFPLNVNGYAELKKIRGIGEDIASRLNAAWKNACENYFETGEPSLDQVKALQKGEAYGLLESASIVNVKAKYIPFVPRQKKSQNVSSQSQVTGIRNTQKLNILNTSSSQPTSSSLYQDDNYLQTAYNRMDYALDVADTVILSAKMKDDSRRKRQVTTISQPQSASSSTSQSQAFSEKGLLSCDPHTFTTFGLRATLIVDEREKNIGSRSRSKTMAEHLTKLNVHYETRVLSVGDFLWLLRLPGGDELVLDYVIERKTWDDLKRSIRDVRYHDQKIRLTESGIRNIVMVIEGKENNDKSLDQAIVSSDVQNRFLIHRTQNLQATAKFLQQLTNRLNQRCTQEYVFGQSFESLQLEARKSRAITVSDCWIQQLTVCPGMSIEKSRIIAERFPSFRSLALFFRQKRSDDESANESLLKKEIPQISAAVSKQLFRFYMGDCST